MNIENINKNLKWISVKIDPIKPKNFSGRFFHCAVICNITYNGGIIEYERDFVDYDFEHEKWECDENCEILFWFPLPDEFDKNNILEPNKKEILKNHKLTWNWIANETLRLKKKVYKHEFFEFMNISECDIPVAECYCCEYDAMFNGDCEHCPIDWGSDANTTMCILKDNDIFDENGLYCKWFNVAESDYEEASRLAREIANLPER